MQRIEADLLIPGRGEPVRPGVVVWDGGVITYAGPAPGAPDAPVVARAATVMPGLWDCHAHFIGVRSLDLALIPQLPVALRAARATADLRAALDAGVTSVREVGGLGIYLAKAVAEGTVEGPAIYSAGSILSTTGGHGDLHSYPLPCASGGVLSEVDHPIHQQFTLAELKAIVEVAGMAERVVAAHCHGKPGIMASLAAGVRTIEHGTYLDEEAAEAMRECGAILVPTRTIVREITDHAAAPPYALAKMEAIGDRHAEAVSLAREAGVTVAMGTDLAVTGPGLPASWGRNGRELPLLVESGFTPLEAIEAATAAAPATLGPQAPRSGLLNPGYDADVITVDGDPLVDITVLANPANVTGVWRAGRRVKGPM